MSARNGASQAPHRSCAIQRNARVFVALADDVELEDYESAGRFAQAIMRRVEHGLCARRTGRVRRSDPSMPSSLRRALELGRSIELEEVRFDDRALARARVLLRSSSPPSAELVIRVYLHLDKEWEIDAVRDESVH